MIPIVWKEFTATVEGSVVKSVNCSNCSTEYLYQMVRRASGTGSSLYMLDNEGASNRASASAQQRLLAALEKDFDPVPCPKCGWYQQFMIPKMKRQHWKWLMPIEIVLFIAGMIAFIASMAVSAENMKWQTDETVVNMVIGWVVFAAIVGAFIGLPILKYIKFQHFDPNLEDEASRIALGQSLAITRADLEKAQQEASGG